MALVIAIGCLLLLFIILIPFMLVAAIRHRMKMKTDPVYRLSVERRRALCTLPHDYIPDGDCDHSATTIGGIAQYAAGNAQLGHNLISSARLNELDEEQEIDQYNSVATDIDLLRAKLRNGQLIRQFIVVKGQPLRVKSTVYDVKDHEGYLEGRIFSEDEKHQFVVTFHQDSSFWSTLEKF